MLYKHLLWYENRRSSLPIAEVYNPERDEAYVMSTSSLSRACSRAMSMFVSYICKDRVEPGSKIRDNGTKMAL